MNLLSILIEKSANKIQKKIQPTLESFYDEGINVEERIYYVDPFYYLDYSVNVESIKNYPVNDFINIFKFCVSTAIYEYIRDYEVPSLIEHIINTDYSYFNAKEKLEIYRNCLNMLKDENIYTFSTEDDNFNSKTKVLNELITYLNSDITINLSGFILFRLKDYLLHLSDIIERAVEDFLVDKEYNEFIKLLNYFVDVQEAKLNMVNVVFDKESTFKIYDEHNKLLNYDYITNIAIEFSESNIKEDDMLISSLITIAPNEIIIHKLPTLTDRGIIKTLESIFPNRIHYCNGCKWCSTKINANKE